MVKEEFDFAAVPCLQILGSPGVCEKWDLASFDPAAGKPALPLIAQKQPLKGRSRSPGWLRRSRAWGGGGVEGCGC